MTARCFLNVPLLLFLFQMCFVNPNPAPKSGPFRSVILSVEDCTKTSRPFMNNPPLIFKATVHNNTGKVNMLSGNLTVLRDTKNIKTKMKGFLKCDGKWQQIFIMNSLDCHGMLIHTFNVINKIKYDRKNCMFMKGSYSYTDMDINQLHHVWASTMEYGLSMWRIESSIRAGTIFCKEFYTVTESI